MESLQAAAGRGRAARGGVWGPAARRLCLASPQPRHPAVLCAADGGRGRRLLNGPLPAQGRAGCCGGYGWRAHGPAWMPAHCGTPCERCEPSSPHPPSRLHPARLPAADVLQDRLTYGQLLPLGGGAGRTRRGALCVLCCVRCAAAVVTRGRSLPAPPPLRPAAPPTSHLCLPLPAPRRPTATWPASMDGTWGWLSSWWMMSWTTHAAVGPCSACSAAVAGRRSASAPARLPVTRDAAGDGRHASHRQRLPPRHAPAARRSQRDGQARAERPAVGAGHRAGAVRRGGVPRAAAPHPAPLQGGARCAPPRCSVLLSCHRV